MRWIRAFGPWDSTLSIASQELAGPETGSARCVITGLRFDGHATEELQSNSDLERMVLVLEGAVVVDAGDEHQILSADEFIFIPRDRPHRLRNPDLRPAIVLEIKGPVADKGAGLPPAADRALLDLVRNFGKHARFEAHRGHGQASGIQSLPLVDRKTGSEYLRIFASVSPPGTGLGHHIHPFDQFYFVLEGELEGAIGLEPIRAHAGQLVHFVEGVVHRNHNGTNEPVRMITINVPEPEPGRAGAISVSLEENSR